METLQEETEAYVSLGSNIGERAVYLREALDLVDHASGSSLEKVSSVYETEPVDYLGQPRFLNLAARVRTRLGAKDFLRQLKHIEEQVGRTHREKWHEREIDIDIIYFGKQIINTEELTVPHPRARRRRFVLEPLNELAPDFVDPVESKSVSELLRRCGDRSEVRLVPGLSMTRES